MKFEFLKDWSVIIFSPDHTDEIIEYTRTRPHEKLVCRLTRPVETFTLKVPLKPEERKRVFLLTILNIFFLLFKKDQRDLSKTQKSGFCKDDESFWK